MRRILFLAVLLAACAASAFAGGLEDAKGFLDKAAPGDCELLMMQYEAMSLPVSSEAQNGVVAQMKRRLAERERDGVAERVAFDAARASLTPAERAELQRYATALYSGCAARAEAAFHVRVPAAPSRSATPLKVAPYVPAREKSTARAAEQPAALQRVPVDP